MSKKAIVAISLLMACVLPLTACDRVSDTTLKQEFNAKRDQLSRLVRMSSEDRQMARISADDPSSALSTQRLNQYRALFKEAGIEGGLERRDDFPSAIFFYVDCSGSAVDRDCKGFAYSEKPLAPLKNKLNLAPGVAFERVSGNWYLFRDGG